MFLHLLALGNSSRESIDASHVRYPLAFVDVVRLSEAIAADVQTRQQCPLGDVIIGISINNSS